MSDTSTTTADAQQLVQSGLKSFLDFELIQLAGQPLSVATLLAALLLLALTLLVSRMVQGALARTGRAKGLEEEHMGVINRLVHYVVMAVGIMTSVETLGFDLSAMFAAGAVFAVGLGFAMQTIAEGFVAGVILLVEGAIKPGDVLELDGRVVRVLKMNIRSTILRTSTGTEIILPNSELVKSPVTNLTLTDRNYRVDVTIGVAYDSDMELVEQTLLEVARAMPFAVAAQSREVRLVGFGASSVDWEICVWTRDPWSRPNHRDDIFHAAWKALKSAGVTIAYPQLDVHLDERVVTALEARVAS